MTCPRIYGIPGSPFLRSVLMGLKEKGADYELVPMGPGDAKSPEHMARNPFGRTPVVDHGEIRLYETQAILRYFDKVLPGPALTPADPLAAARMDQLVGINDWYVFPRISVPITFNRVVAPHFGLPVDEAAVVAALPQAAVCLAELERLLGEQAYMAGDALTIADLMLAPHLSAFAVAPEGMEMLAVLPRIGAWLDRMQARPSMVETTWERLDPARQAA